MSTSGAMVFSGIMFFLYSFITSKSKATFRVFGAMCFTTAFYQWTALNIHSSSTIIEAKKWVELQSLTVSLFFPFYVAFVALISKYKHTKVVINFTATIYTIQFIIKLFTNGTRYKTITELREVPLIWGETLYIPYGSPHILHLIFLPIGIGAILWACWRGYQMIRMGKRSMGIIFTLFTIGFFASGILTILINHNIVNFFYISGFVMLLFVFLVGMQLAIDSHETRLTLQQALNDRQRSEETLVNISKTINQKFTGNYLEEIALNIQETLNTRFVLIALYPSAKELSIRALVRKGHLLEIPQIQVEGSPNHLLLQGHSVVHLDDLQEQYPNDLFITENFIKSFIGTPLKDDQNQTLGHLAVMDTKPFEKGDFLEKSLEIYAAQVSAQLIKEKAQAQLERLAYYDYLTQLPNRARLHNDLETTFYRSHTNNYDSALIYLDLIDFKNINNFLGAGLADQLLAKLGQRFNQMNTLKVTPYRLTGDEFIFIIEKVESLKDLDSFAEKLHKIVNHPVTIADHQINIECTLGAICFPSQVEEISDILPFAETALNEAKNDWAKEETHNNTELYRLFDPKVQADQNFRIEMEAELRVAIYEKQMELYFQPQINESEKAFGAEVLVRWNHPTKGFISPAIFIPIAEETGLIHTLGDWILEESIKTAYDWYQSAAKVPPHLSINISAWQFNTDDFILKTQQYLKQYPVPTDWLVYELTETAFINEIETTKEKLNELREMGISIALDDFGTGYSSLAYVKDLPLDYIKIDKAFVDQLEESTGSGLVETIISMGKHMNLKIIAEGTETIEQIDQLKAFGCKLFQGFYYSKPISRSDYEQWIQDKL